MHFCGEELAMLLGALSGGSFVAKFVAQRVAGKWKLLTGKRAGDATPHPDASRACKHHHD